MLDRFIFNHLSEIVVLVISAAVVLKVISKGHGEKSEDSPIRSNFLDHEIDPRMRFGTTEDTFKHDSSYKDHK